MTHVSFDAVGAKRARSEASYSDDHIAAVGRNQLTPSPATPKRVACTHCRQSKLRCESSINPGQKDCVRCHRLGLDCSTDTSYKRVNKKSKIDELEQHVHQLQAVLQNSTVATNIPVVPAVRPNNSAMNPLATFPTISNGILGQSSVSTPVSVPTMNASPPVIFTGVETLTYIRPRAVKIRAIDSVALDQHQIDSLFELYFTNYHQFFPLLDPMRSPDDYYENSVLLFWQVVCIGARRYSDATIVSSLESRVKKIAWERISEIPISIHDTQALLLASVWPPTTVRMWSDDSLTLTHIVTSAVMQLGLHRPDYAIDFVKTTATVPESARLERMKTIAASHIVCQFMTLNFGYPPTLWHGGWVIDRACEAGSLYSLPDDLRHLLLIERFLHRVAKAMCGNSSDQLGLPSENENSLLMDILSRDLDTLESQFGAHVSSLNKLHLLAARMDLHLFYWVGHAASDQRRAGILKSFGSASSFVAHIVAADDEFHFAAHAPFWLLLALLRSSYVLLRILCSSLSAHIDFHAGVRLFEAAIAILRRFSIMENDLPTRVVAILSDTWDHRDDSPDEKYEEPTMKCQSRLGASVITECLQRWRKRNLGGLSPTAQAAKISSFFPLPTGPATNNQVNWDLIDELCWDLDFEFPLLPSSIG